MIRSGFVKFFAVAALATVTHARAEEGVAACPAPASLPPALASWGAPHGALTAAAKRSSLKLAQLDIGKAVDAQLVPTPQVKYVVQPGKPGGSVSYGGMFAFTVTEPGNYRVALNAHSWTDVVENGAALQSFAHGHGPDCTGVSKMVDYALRSGPHVLQIAANGDPQLSVMVVKLP